MESKSPEFPPGDKQNEHFASHPNKNYHIIWRKKYIPYPEHT